MFTLESRVKERFFSHVAMWPSGCWWWLGSNMGKMKYGVFWIDGKKVVAHRWAYENFIGDIPEDKESHHRCEVPWSVNPYHIELMTREDHSKTKNHYMRENCVRGHKMSGDNIKVRKRFRHGRMMEERVCLTCKRERDNELYARAKNS